MTTEFCKVCGQGVFVMCQKNTGFCTPTCAEKYDPFPGD